MKEVNPETFDFIKNHLHDDTAKLLFQKDRFPNIDISFAIQQITGYKKALDKFPSLAQNEHFLYPVGISMEQCSSEYTARYKANLLKGKMVVDITGGLGIDSLFISKEATEAFYVEQDTKLCQIAAQNFTLFPSQNLHVYCSNGLDFLKQSNARYDCIYLDPSRRNSNQKKVFLLQDCSPNVLEHKEFLFSKTDMILLKTSPMLDISKATIELKSVHQVHIIAVNNECKELLFVCSPKTIDKIEHICINIKNNHYEQFCFSPTEEASLHIEYASLLKEYLYEPNAAILKAGAFKTVAEQFQIEKLHLHSHLYTSDNRIENFPGKIFCIKTYFHLNENKLKEHIPNKKANIVVRNFPLSPEQIRKKHKLLDGGELFIFATTLHNGEKVIILCEKA